ncbi:hypothetical protein AKJ52_00930 [candidate division MSBL1 archaeon SCGC-AAA382C18]|uniref:Uncharacterized protein n=1 Tax=candidate division MSBL1 archaeon SCGC-AAA382C18 TaxID=1698281 RepID=A0A133VKZ1_9EURY|nr:hypothetical protein AKJ52_00930 [candidate division MSBL1 archaeon SCGC-AAA382C18]
MPQLKVTETFERGGDTYEKGKTYVVAEETAEWAEMRGYGLRPGNEPEKEEIPKLEAPGPENVWAVLKRKAESGGDKPPNWNPEKGDWLFGTVKKTGEGKNGRFAVVEVAEEPVKAKQKLEESGYEEEAVQPGDEVLLWEVKDLNDFFDRIRGGSKAAVQYTGKAKTSKGHVAKLFNRAVGS